MSYICHIDPSLYLKSRLSSHVSGNLLFADHKLSFLFVWIRIFTTEEDFLKKVHVILRAEERGSNVSMSIISCKYCKDIESKVLRAIFSMG